MSYIQGEGRSQGTLFPVVLDDLIPADHVCRVLDAFVAGLAMAELGFERAEAAETGRPGYDPRDLLKLYLYGYLHQLRSSRRLEAECRRNVELMWLLGRLYPDHKSIAEFRRMHREAVTAAGAQLVRFAQSCGLIRGEWVAIDGTKFRAVSSADSVRERQALERYLDSMEQADEEQLAAIDPSAVQVALEKLKRHREPEARFMPVARTNAPAYNVQTAVDAEHALIVTHAVTLEAGDNVQLQPMAEAAKKALGAERLQVVADAGYANGEHAARCEAAGILPHVPVKRAVNNQGNGTLFGREHFRYHPGTDTYLCPANKIIRRKMCIRDRSTPMQGLARLFPGVAWLKHPWLIGTYALIAISAGGICAHAVLNTVFQSHGFTISYLLWAFWALLAALACLWRAFHCPHSIRTHWRLAAASLFFIFIAAAIEAPALSLIHI